MMLVGVPFTSLVQHQKHPVIVGLIEFLIGEIEGLRGILPHRLHLFRPFYGVSENRKGSH